MPSELKEVFSLKKEINLLMWGGSGGGPVSVDLGLSYYLGFTSVLCFRTAW